MEEKLAIAFYNNPKELLNQRFVIFDDIRKVDYLVDELRFNFILFIYFCLFIYANLILSSGLLM